MDDAFLAPYLAAYEEYVGTFRDASGKLPDLMALKLAHTRRVLENARLIADAERFAPDERRAALLAALLHDTGRYEQLRRYGTFRDSDSVDHAVYSHRIVVEKGWTDDPAVLDAVLFHNRRDLPDGLDRVTSAAARAVRDADKLDIFRVLEEIVAKEGLHDGSTAFWGLSLAGGVSPEVQANVDAGLPVDYQAIRTLADFIMIQVGWIRSGLYFESSRRFARERGHLAYRERLLAELATRPPRV